MNYDIIVIGAGIVGLATAMKLSLKKSFKKILVLEKESTLASHQTGRNSGVIHSGIYYKPKSLKSKNCRRGYQQLLDFCNLNEVKYEKCGKVIVATNQDEIESLHNIYEIGKKNGLKSIKLISSCELKDFEPHVSGLKAIHVPQTGIIDYKVLAEKFAEILKSNGGKIELNSKVVGIETDNSKSIKILTENKSYTTKYLINCSGLFSDRIYSLHKKQNKIKIIPFRGEYYKLKSKKKYLVKNLVYPVPDMNFPFLGVHFTRMINGDVEAGPNAVLAFAREGYLLRNINFNELMETLTFRGFQKIALKYWKYGLSEMHRSFSKKAFTKALQKLIPEINNEDLEISESGVRAQACSADGKLIDDFFIDRIGNIIHVINAPSPAATSSLSIADHIIKLIQK